MSLNIMAVCMIQYLSWILLYGSAVSLICNEDKFDPSEKLCCGGKLYPLRDKHNRTQSCCTFNQSTKEGESTERSELYNKVTHFCCGTIRRKHDGDGIEWHCCKGKPYRKDKHICCGSHLELLNNSDAKKDCCGGKFYDFKSQVCCRNTLHHRKENQTDENYMECCGDERYDARNHRCEHSSEDFPKVLRIHLGNCSRQEYNMTTHICCDGKVKPIPEPHKIHSYRCCGDKPFETTHMKCCNNNHLIPKSKECCGNDSHDPVHQRCCSGVPNNLSSFPTKSKCCGTRLISVRDICCNGKHGDLNFQCCGEKLIGKQERCCEGRALEPFKICCEEQSGATKQIEKGKVSDTDCCTYRKDHKQFYEPYDRMNQICLKGVFEKSTVPTKTRTILNPTTKLPASEKLKEKDIQANINVTCNRKMNSKDLRVIKIEYDDGNLILHVQQKGNLQAGEHRNFKVILKKRIHIQVGKMYRIYTTQKIGFTKNFYKSETDVLIRKKKKNIRHFKKFCEVKSILERSLQRN